MTLDDLRSIGAVLPEPCLFVEPSGRVVTASHAAASLLGRSPSDVGGADLRSLVTDDPGRVDRMLSAAARSRGPVAAALTLAGARPLPCAFSAGLLQPATEDGPAIVLVRFEEKDSGPSGFQVLNEQIDQLNMEIRHRRQAEARAVALLSDLERQRILLKESQRSADVGSWEWEVGTGNVVWSDQLYRIYGLDPQGDPIDMDRYASLLHPDDRDDMFRTVERALEDHQPYAVDHRIVRPDGEIRVIHGRGRTIRDEAGAVERLVGSGQDVTDRHRAEQNIRFLASASHVLATSLDVDETLRTVADLAVERIADWAIIDIMEDGALRRLAARHRDPERVRVAEELARRWPPDPDAPGSADEVARTGESRLIAEVTDEILDRAARDPEHKAVLKELGMRSAMQTPMRARDTVLGVLTFIAAESGRRYDEDDLRLAEGLAERAALAIDNAHLYLEARKLARARDELVAVVSHDLRSPLNAVLAGASLLLDTPLSEEKRRKQYAAILRSARRMERLTGDLLDITRIEAGAFPIDPRPQPVSPIMTEALESARDTADQAGVTLAVEVADPLPLVAADRDRLLQVMDNLLVNAIRHTPVGGRVTVGANRSETGVRFTVSDTGPGVAEEMRDRIFDRYCQADGNLHGGAGLGLPIAKGIVEAHGGRIWLEAPAASGAVFVFEIPYGSAPDGPRDSGTGG